MILKRSSAWLLIIMVVMSMVLTPLAMAKDGRAAPSTSKTSGNLEEVSETIEVSNPEANENLKILISNRWIDLPTGEIVPPVTLYLVNSESGEHVKSVTLENGEASHLFDGLSEFDSKGNKVKYSVVSDTINDFKTVIDKYEVRHTYIQSESKPEDEAIVDEEIEEVDSDADAGEGEESGEAEETDSSIVEGEEPEAIEEIETEEPQPSDGEKVDPIVVEENLSDEVVGKTHPPFATTSSPYALKGIPSGDNWGQPGSIKLTKDAKPTDKYAEWEIELTVQGKNLRTSSDIVLVFDRSNSMYPSRLSKAKAAAKEFVDNLLIEGSTARIALVPFGTNGDTPTDFKGVSGKQALKNAIDAIKVTNGNDGGTNIQAGLRSARTLIANSTADKKTIVLLSDGAPTYSFKASSAQGHTWPNNKYNFILSESGTTQLGSGSDYNLPIGFLGFGDHRYTVNGYQVKTNGIPTISEAKHIMNAGIDIYSVGLEVGSDADATYVLQNSQNKGYYAGGDDDLTPIFNSIAASLNYAATNAIVTDPLGEMFDLVKDGSYNGANYAASHGTVSWDDATETFTWNIGAIKENEIYSLKYKVTMDWDKNPEGNVLYPTNKETPLNYENPEGIPSTKQFPIPKVGIDKGKIVKKGYRVNIDGDPIDSNGDVVNSPADAEQFYNDVFGESLVLDNTYSVPSNNVVDYTLIVGTNPTDIHLTLANPYKVVWFGYVKTSEMVAGEVTATYVDLEGNTIASSETLTGNIGAPYSTVQKVIEGYIFKEMGLGSAPESGTFTANPQNVIYVYEKLLGSIKVIKVDGEDNSLLIGATFELQDMDGNVISTETTDENGEILFENLVWGDYQLVETIAPDGYRKLTKPILITIGVDNLHIIETVENSKNGWDIPKTGGIGTAGFYGFGALLMAITLGFFLRKRRPTE